VGAGLSVDAPPLSRFQRIVIRFFGCVRIGWVRGPGWSAWLPVYAFECGRHGVVVNYGQGFEGRLVCPICESGEVSGG
jgi:hypothetical protein